MPGNVNFMSQPSGFERNTKSLRSKIIFSLFCLLVIFIAPGCGGNLGCGGSESGNSLTLIVNNPNVTVNCAANGTVTGVVTGRYEGGRRLAVTGLPTGVTASANPSGDFFSELLTGIPYTVTFSASAAAAAGTSTVRLNVYQGTQVITFREIQLTVSACEAASFDFGLSAADEVFSFLLGESDSSPITATLTSGTGGPVTFSVLGLPTGVTASFSPASVTPTGGAGVNTVLTLTAGPTADVSEGTITVRGVGGGKTRDLPMTLNLFDPADS